MNYQKPKGAPNYQNAQIGGGKVKNKFMGKIIKNLLGQVSKSKNLKIFRLYFWALVLFPTLAFAMNYYETYRSKQNPNYFFQYEDCTKGMQIAVYEVETCIQWSLERQGQVIRCAVNSGREGAPHFYFQGRVVDDQLDQVAEQISLNRQKTQAESVKNDQRFINILLAAGILLLVGLVGFICACFGSVVVFSSILDLVLYVGIPILGGIIVLIGDLCSENGHMYGINFSYQDIQVFLLIWFSLWIIWNAVQSFRHNNAFLALLALISRITAPVFILFFWSRVTSAFDRFSNHCHKK
ncbi:MAG: hypothetical protein WC484_03360 [Candidatus Omnitrophota bacterium]